MNKTNLFSCFICSYQGAIINAVKRKVKELYALWRFVSLYQWPPILQSDWSFRVGRSNLRQRVFYIYIYVFAPVCLFVCLVCLFDSGITQKVIDRFSQNLEGLVLGRRTIDYILRAIRICIRIQEFLKALEEVCTLEVPLLFKLNPDPCSPLFHEEINCCN